MLFPTVEFALFFVVALAVAWELYRFPEWHKRFLLVASYVFYGFWNWLYVPLLLVISLIAGWVAQRIERTEDEALRKRWLIRGIAACLAALVYYKYTGFILTTAFGIWGIFGVPPAAPIAIPLLPIGVSFFVFHAISLLMDVYRRKLRGPVHMEDALLYVAFFPQLIAGPILRASSFLPQLRVMRNPETIRVNRGLMLIVAGLFKKVIISNMLATRLVDPVFLVPQSYARWDTLLAVYGYAAQIYCDFSGYTDIAIGCALLLGYRFPRNFNSPYTATDPQDFWKRWHISLSSWLRDYLYIPLGGSRGTPRRTMINLMITMLLGGLWHGAAWTFVIWGGLQGAYLAIHRLWASTKSETIQNLRETEGWTWISRILMFHAVCFGWIFFRAPTFEIAFSILRNLSVAGAATLLTGPVLLVLVLGLAGQYQPRRWRKGIEGELARWPAFARGAALAAAVIGIELLGPSGVAPFIYFQF
ncbi:MAG TPA: MBOAT family O-acyltransferase [Terriglobia bacterium]|nr:MBOAT family O-acyltransferase [Terriglobia bacterium]